MTATLITIVGLVVFVGGFFMQGRNGMPLAMAGMVLVFIGIIRGFLWFVGRYPVFKPKKDEK